MAISTYSDLQDAVANWMARTDLTGDAADFIMLGESHLNREIPAVELDVTLTGTPGSRSIDVSAHSVAAPVALFLVDGDEVMLTPKADGTFPYLESSGRPSWWAMDGSNVDFDRPLDAAYFFRFRIQQKFALSDAAPTNWLLMNHPDVYLAATLMWGGVFTQDSPFASNFSAILERVIPSITNQIAQSKRAVLSVDPALALIGRRRYEVPA